MTDHDPYSSDPAAHDVLMRMQAEPDWAPPGGTSNRRHNQLNSAYLAEFRAKCTARVAARADLWLREFSGAAMYVGYHDDQYGGYFVHAALQHHIHLPEDRLRAVCYLTYTRVDDNDRIVHCDADIGRRYFEPPNARDVTRHIDHLLAALDAHRQLLPPEHTPTNDTTPEHDDKLADKLADKFGGERPAGHLYYTSYEQARAAAYYYAQGRQDDKAAGYRQEHRFDLVVQTRDSADAERFADRYAAAFQAYRDEIAGMGVHLEDAYDNWLDHGHCYGIHECPTCGRFITPPKQTGHQTGEQGREQDVREPLAERRCSRCDARLRTAPVTQHGTSEAG